MTDFNSRTPVSGHDPIITRGRMDSLAAWAAEAVDVILNGGTSDTAIASPTLSHEVVWSKDSRTFHTTIETDGSQSDLDSQVAAFKVAVVAAGGTVVSG